MHKRNTEQKNNYFGELAHNLQREGVNVLPEQGGCLPVELDGQALCRITDSGAVRYREKDVVGNSRREALWRVTDIVAVTHEYMSRIESAPALKADSLDESYKLLADFSGTVLAGHLTKYGVQFITWSRNPGGTSLNQGIYYGPGSGVDSYTAAKQNFAVRSGLVDANHLFTQEQMVEIYRSTQASLDNDNLSSEQERLLEEIRKKIQRGVPDLEEQLAQNSRPEPAQGMEQSW